MTPYLQSHLQVLDDHVLRVYLCSPFQISATISIELELDSQSP